MSKGDIHGKENGDRASCSLFVEGTGYPAITFIYTEPKSSPMRGEKLNGLLIGIPEKYGNMLGLQVINGVDGVELRETGGKICGWSEMCNALGVGGFCTGGNRIGTFLSSSLNSRGLANNTSILSLF